MAGVHLFSDTLFGPLTLSLPRKSPGTHAFNQSSCVNKE